MPEYRYFTGDLRTGDVLGDLPLFGVYMNRQLSQAGDFTGTYLLGTGKYIDDILLGASEPGRTAVYAERDGEIIWGGILWTRTYQSESKTVQLSAQTFESYFDHIALDTHFVMKGVEQTEIFRQLINQCQAQSGGNIGLILDSFPVTGIPRTVLLAGYDYNFAQTGVDAVVGVDQGIEYMIDVVDSGVQDKPNKVVRVGFPQYGSTTNTGLDFDFPGNIDTYWWPESATNGGIKIACLGYGSGYDMVRAEVIDGDKLAAGYPGWWKVNSYKTINDKAQIAAIARKDIVKFGVPVSNPTFQLMSDVGVGFTGWHQLGDTFTCHIEDVRFPGGKDYTSRLIGWELQPADADNTEILKLVTEGDSQ